MKPRDKLGNDLIVPCTALALQIAQSAGLEADREFVKKLADGLYSEELKRVKLQSTLSPS